jgi:hypothetical protein
MVSITVRPAAANANVQGAMQQIQQIMATATPGNQAGGAPARVADLWVFRKTPGSTELQVLMEHSRNRCGQLVVCGVLFFFNAPNRRSF